jgi:hypothetical protein
MLDACGGRQVIEGPFVAPTDELGSTPALKVGLVGDSA